VLVDFHAGADVDVVVGDLWGGGAVVEAAVGAVVDVVDVEGPAVVVVVDGPF
jgi:hypothetical protein